MQVPLEISFHGMETKPHIQDLIHEKTEKLEQVCDYMSSCRVAIEKPQEHVSSGNPYRVRLDINVPHNHRITVEEGLGDTDMHAELHQLVRRAFKVARRQLKNLVEQQKSHQA
jgi:ribosome-associated translation inhibitor RaiA